ncbi:DUF3265 domain-containing protein [Vibrio diazotrophicus]|nr:DUF3265 domain-containing protein [Vibrio diazotrophicus]
MTNNLRVIRHAWHFYYALVFVILMVCGNIGIGVPHTLIGRYASMKRQSGGYYGFDPNYRVYRVVCCY